MIPATCPNLRLESAYLADADDLDNPSAVDVGIIAQCLIVVQLPGGAALVLDCDDWQRIDTHVRTHLRIPEARP